MERPPAGIALAGSRGKEALMATKRYVSTLLGFAVMLLVLAPAALANDSAAPKKDCDMTYTLKGWSAIYKTAHGEGTITCNNGQTANVSLKVIGGGATFGKTDIYHGKAEISGVHSINDIFGSYAAASAHAAVGKAAEAQVMTKGKVSLALAGHGEGVDVGLDVSKFTISKAGAEKPASKSK